VDLVLGLADYRAQDLQFVEQTLLLDEVVQQFEKVVLGFADHLGDALQAVEKSFRLGEQFVQQPVDDHRGEQTLLADGRLVEIARGLASKQLVDAALGSAASLGHHLQVVGQILPLDEQLVDVAAGPGDHPGYCFQVVEQSLLLDAQVVEHAVGFANHFGLEG